MKEINTFLFLFETRIILFINLQMNLKEIVNMLQEHLSNMIYFFCSCEGGVIWTPYKY